MNEKDTKFKVWKLCGEFNTHKQAVELNLEEESIIDFALGSLSRQIDNLDDANKGPKGF